VPIPPDGKVEGVVLTDQTKSIDYVARDVSCIGEVPIGLAERVLERLEPILFP
jgi:mRNA-degrading endonuclease toxin of MazEF toxin-antitoxin module